MKEALIEVRNVTTSFRIADSYYKAIDRISLTINKNEILAIVGESGCGKSTLATSIVGLHNSNNTKVEGEIVYKSTNLVTYTEEQFEKIRGDEIGYIFQDPLAALNPLMKVGKQIEESLYYHMDLTKEERTKRTIKLLKQVGINSPERVANQFPHQLSGGMRQRIMIAIAISCKPQIIIADEPTTALDVTIQAQILDLLTELQNETGTGILLITHDLGVVAEMADRVIVMYAGEIVEEAPVEVLFNDPKHPYTRSLLNSIPQNNSESEELKVIQRTVPSLTNMPKNGCRFSTRISWIAEEFHEVSPELHEVAEGHFVRCTCWEHFTFNHEGEVDHHELFAD